MSTSCRLLIACVVLMGMDPALAQEIPVQADMVVALDGTGDFTSIQAAIDAVPSNDTRTTVIYIRRGLYDTEKLIVPADRKNVTLIGESREETVISYHIYDCASGKCPAEDAALWTGDNIRTSATLTILGDGFRAENMTIQNTAGPVGQAQAVTVRADRCVFIHVDFYGYQDTMYFWSDGNRSYFKECLVVGRTDYIYGSGTVYFDACEIRSWGGGWITAPSTAQDQPYGFVFSQCDITYADNSPRGGDDGQFIRLGRPWHNYPKVAWLNCVLTGMIHPEGWGDTWNMDYAASSEDLHLYEYNNTGEGADMSNRANWAGLGSLSETEALEYTVQKVLGGTDNWDPAAEAPVVQTYRWTGKGAQPGWMISGNWDPEGTPSAGETGMVDSAFTLLADGGTFAADLMLKNYATLDVTESSIVSYLSMSLAGLSTSGDVALGGRIATRDSMFTDIAGSLVLDAHLTGVHSLVKTGTGTLTMNADNSGFSGGIRVEKGILNAPVSGALGRSSILLQAGAELTVGNDNAIHAKARLAVQSGSVLHLDGDITISEFYMDEVLQAIGEYSSATHPDLIQGTGRIHVGRPDTFLFHRGENGNWDVPEHYTPALFPQEGETVICEEEMETTSTPFVADIILQNGGHLRLRGDPGKNHTCTGTLFLDEGTSFRYNTSGSGMYLHAPVVLLGDVSMVMESSNSSGSTLTLAGSITGDNRVIALNSGKGTPNTGTLLLTGDNSGFTGTWDVTTYSSKYPSVPGYISILEGKGENAFGKGHIRVGLENRVLFSHPGVAGDSLVLTLTESAKAVLNVDVHVDQLILNGIPLDSGIYSSGSHPDLFEGAGRITVGESGGGTLPDDNVPAFPGAEGHGKYVSGGRGGEVYYVTTLQDHNKPGSLRYAVGRAGARTILFNVSGTIRLTSRLTISNGNMTIAGQTAPGDGITLRDYPVVVDADNVIIRFLRFRMGDAAAQEGDALGGRFHRGIMVDHCSMSWSTDECVSFYHNEDFTLQWSIISESLRNSVHEKGAHGYGGIWGGKRASFHHNLLAHHDSRNPRLGEAKGDIFALTDLVDLRNNVIYNWKGNSAYGGEAMNANIVNCYYKPGPATTKIERIISIDKLLEPEYPIYDTWGKFYIDGNVLTASARATEDNWTYGVYNQFNAKYTVTTADKEDMRLGEELDPGEVYTHPAEEAYDRILRYAGASLTRDTVDRRIVHEVATGTATYMDGGNGSSNGIIDTQEAVGGWPELSAQPAPLDRDRDGIPDYWEEENGLDPNDDGDAQLKTLDGLYPNLELYLHSLVKDIVDYQNEGEAPADTSTHVGRGYPPDGWSDLLLYYHPLSNELRIKHSSRISRIAVYSVSGVQITSKDFHSSEFSWRLPDIPSGIYVIRLQDEYRHGVVKKIQVLR